MSETELAYCSGFSFEITLDDANFSFMKNRKPSESDTSLLGIW